MRLAATYVIGSLLLAALSLLLPSAPGYDPLAWLVWGREVASLDLDTSSGPAWKPLPVGVTSVLAFMGDAAAALWLVLARAAGILALVAAFRLAARLAPDPFALLAGVAAAAALVLVDGFVHGVALGNSEGMFVAAALAAWERQLAGREGQALALALVAALLRVEAWPFVLLLAAIAWRREPRLRRPILVAAALVPLAWFGPELWGSGDAMRSSERARIPNPGAPALVDEPALEVVSRFGAMLPPALFAAAAVALVRRRARVLAVAAAAWVGLVAAMSELGYSGEERYLLPAAAAAGTLSGVGLAHLGAAASARHSYGRPAAVTAAVALFFALAALALPEARDAAADLRHAARLHHDLRAAVAAAGGADRLVACGAPYTGRYRFPAVAWRLRVPISALSLDPQSDGVVFRSPLTRRSEPAPLLPRGLERVAARGLWSIHARCEGSA
jgi:hypothetical protein